MLPCIGAQITPKVVCECVFLKGGAFQDVPHSRFLVLKNGGSEGPRLAKANDENALPMLWHHVFRVQHDGRIDVIAQVLPQGFVDSFNGPSLVMSKKMLHVLQHEGFWVSLLDDSLYFKEERALGLVAESVRLVEAVLFGYP
jgi:hypothetical protein